MNERAARERDLHPSPPLVLLAALFAALSIAAVIVVVVMTGGGHVPSPFEPAGPAAAFFAGHGRAVQVGALLAFAAAVPLGLLAASMSSRLRFLGLSAAGVTIGLFGGIAASVMLAASGLAMWVLSQPGVADVAASARALHLLAFAAGGPGHVVPLGLLVAGAAVSAGLGRLLPRWMMVFGLAVAVIAEVATFSLLAPALAYALPVARLGALVWLIGASAMLPRARP